jgi:hypothetical protein
MATLDQVLVQLFQPYFFYSLVFLSIAFVSIIIFTKFAPFLSRRLQSAIWLIPLSIPACILLLFPPQIMINASYSLPQLPTSSGMGVMWLTGSTLFSYAGLLCMIVNKRRR